MDQIQLGVTLMCYGIAGVFSVLALFILLIKAIVKLFPAKLPQDEGTN